MKMALVRRAYSPVVNVRFGKLANPTIVLFPNPATATTTLDLSELPEGNYQVRLTDVVGRTVLSATLSANPHVLDLKPYAAGSYVLLVQGSNGGQVVNLTRRLVKE